jgi:hypothetical protein
MSDRRDMTGVWYGRYVGSADAQRNSFIAVLEEQAGVFAGTITEPDSEGGGGVRSASVAGRRQGGTIDFVKQYHGRWTHSVQYLGSVDAEGLAASGSWRVEWLDGRFTMQREQFSAEELEAEETERVEVDAALPKN